MWDGKTGYTMLTYRFRFYDKHLHWLCETKFLYNRVVKHYYHLLIEHSEWLIMTNFNLMRKLELMTVGNREMKKAGQTACYPLLDFPTIPLYFRRAAINCAISMMRSYQTQMAKAKERADEKISKPSLAGTFSSAPVYYKGMYKEFKKDSILLKVFTGEKWVWNQYRFQGRIFPKEAQPLSPFIKIEKKQAYLHVPVKLPVKNTQSVKERMQTEERILAVSFPGNDSIAIGAVITRKGIFEKATFFQGGRRLKAEKNTLKRKLKKLKKKQESLSQSRAVEKYRKKIEQVNDYYAHLVSRRILDVCEKEEIQVIVVPNYQQVIDFSHMRYLKTDNYEWIGRRIICYLKYKAYKEGRIVSTVPATHISDCCSECGAKIKRYNEGHKPGTRYFGGQLFCCPNGHQGSSGLNTARNIGKKFLSYYPLE